MKSKIGRLVAAVIVTLAIMWVVPLPVYAAFSELPEPTHGKLESAGEQRSHECLICRLNDS
jgi:hypothetical protein